VIQGRITASHVGRERVPNSERRTCFRCGCERAINGRQPKGKAFLCGDCKSVDRALARRLGLSK
jgi:hypothetical protein